MVTNVALRISQIISWLYVIAVLVMAIIAIGFLWGFGISDTEKIVFTLLVAFFTLYYLSTRFESFFIQKKIKSNELRLLIVENAVAELQARKR